MKTWLEQIAVTEGFEWEWGNERKSQIKHGVSPMEAQETFKNRPLILVDDPLHSKQEKRGKALGKTDKERWLHITFTLRNNLIRIISARDMHRKERKVYEAQN